MHRPAAAAIATMLSVVAVDSATALEKTSARLTDDETEWRGSFETCYVIYYNFCTSWVWVWSGWEARSVVGVAVETCCPPSEPGLAYLDVSWHYVRVGFPPGWGFTGTVDVHAADANRCPTGAALDSQIFFAYLGWNGFVWSQPVPSTFVVSITTGPGTTFVNPLAFDTDHPAAGPTGPAACGFCYPTDRVTHSYYYGTATTPLCPGSPFDDGVCNAELRWEFGQTVSCLIGVEPTSWGKVKSLYR